MTATAMNVDNTSSRAATVSVARDRELPLLAAKAAAEIDALMRGEKATSGAVAQFAARLRNLKLDRSDNQMVRSMDPGSSRMLKMASERAKLASDIDSYRELSKVLLRIERMLEDLGRNTRRQELDKLRSFFISVSDLSAAERRAFVSRPTQPYRR